MTGEQEQRWQALAPWYTRWTFGERDYGGDWQDDGMRVKQFHARFGLHRGRVLELSCLEGAHTTELARHCDGLLALEGRQANVERTRLVLEVLDVTNVEVSLADLETVKLAEYGRFDAVFCVGLLYHLVNPGRLLWHCQNVSNALFLWTHYSLTEELPGGRWYAEDSDSPTSGLSRRSFWPTRPVLLDWLNGAYSSVEVIAEQLDHPHGPAITLACERRP